MYKTVAIKPIPFKVFFKIQTFYAYLTPGIKPTLELTTTKRNKLGSAKPIKEKPEAKQLELDSRRDRE